jgi:hypothetical protein
MAGKYNIVADQGATFHLNFTVKTDGIPWDLTTYSARMLVAKSTSSSTNLLDLTSAGGDIDLTIGGGQVSITASALAMANLPAGRWIYTIELTSSGSEVTRILEGRFIVSAEVV